MKIIQKKDQMTKLEIEIYQAKNGGIYLNWGNKSILLIEEYAEGLLYHIPDFSVEDYNRFYK